MLWYIVCLALKLNSDKTVRSVGAYADAASTGSHTHNLTPLDTLTLGHTLTAKVLSHTDAGLFVDVGVGRRAKKTLKPIDALVPANQLPDGNTPSDYARGALLDARVLQPMVSSGRLLLSIRDEPLDTLLGRLEAYRRLRDVRRRRRPTERFKQGTRREGVVVRVCEHGLIINVGARRDGLAHISELAQGGFVGDVAEMASVGDVVLVEVLSATSSRLALRYVRTLARPDELLEPSVLATARPGDVLRQRFQRAEDRLLKGGGAQPGAMSSPNVALPSAHGDSSVSERVAQSDEPEDAVLDQPAYDGHFEDDDEGADSGDDDLDDEEYYFDKYEMDTF